VFGPELAKIPISSNKSMIGHTITAAGAIEAAFSIKTIETGTIPPTINYKVPDPAIVLDVVPNVARQASVKTVLSNSFGFGGQNACLVITASRRERQSGSRPLVFSRRLSATNLLSAVARSLAPDER